MAMGPERSKPLHNFTLPCGLKWGNQKFLRCVKVDQSNAQISSVHHRRSEPIGRRKQPDHRSNDWKFRSTDSGGDGIEAVREKLMFDLQTEADKMKDAIFKENLDEKEEAFATPAPLPATAAGSDTAVVDLARPWNLRTRRAACKEPNNGFVVVGAGCGFKIDVVNGTNGASPLRTENRSPKRPSGGAVAVGGCSSGEKRERVKFSVPISRGEIEEDFMAMVGHRPPRRPKKRAKFVQKNLDTLFPGLWLSEITADLYKVPDDQ